ncbi:hypothetical protein J7E91_29205 [Streptomyces sp. ISL-99]|uniref:hypothetical protein n=1 Tax=Streptomyces sp. ISL-99 TaxID=2819193 RepID=UPI001BE65C76|nr:hypothetical protein [Streptomyces sp. ISL-99]MBT2529366.1 hypothetical protein [Streptomyces sp. ISL-99]
MAVLLSGAGLTACGNDQPETPRQTATGIEGVSSEAPAEESPTTGAETPTVEVGETVEFFSQFAGEAGTTLKVKVNKIEYRTKTVEPGEGYTATAHQTVASSH